MNKKVLFSILLGILFLTACPSDLVFAQLGTWCGSGTGTTCFYGIGGIMSSILAATWIIFGVITVVCFVIAGVLFLTAAGDPQKLSQAKLAVIWGAVGVVVGIVAYSIIYLVEQFFLTGS